MTARAGVILSVSTQRPTAPLTRSCKRLPRVSVGTCGPPEPPSLRVLRERHVASCLTAGLLLVSAYHGLHRLPALGLGSRQQEILGISPEIHLQVDVEIHGAPLGALEHITRDVHGGFSAPPTTLSGLTSAAQSTTIIRRAVRRILCLHQRNEHTHFAPRVRNYFFFRVPLCL